MFINPKIALESGWVEFPGWMTSSQRSKCIQPNAIDFTLDRLFTINGSDTATITESSRIMRSVTEIRPDHNKWQLEQNVLYDGMSDFYVHVPENVAAYLIVRSTFNRVGLLLNAGLYDSGFLGNIGFTLYNRSGTLITSPHTRIGQIIFVDSESSSLYDGNYSTTAGQHWATELNNSIGE